MTKTPDKPPHITQQDWDDADSPELTAEDFARAVPFKDAHPAFYAEWKRGRGRPKADAPKLPMNFRLAADIVTGIKAAGRGYNARVEAILREALEQGKFR